MVIRQNSLSADLYIQRGGSWGAYRTARRFASQNAAERYATKHGIEIYGLFP